jgi:hypothetical protein
MLMIKKSNGSNLGRIFRMLVQDTGMSITILDSLTLIIGS